METSFGRISAKAGILHQISFVDEAGNHAWLGTNHIGHIVVSASSAVV
jgi:hypothetical protein